tara:strand:- start:383 stop:715 length:333 start_codon:yes stop_codon:yes gene_type:complete
MAFNSIQAFKVARRFQHKNGVDTRTLNAEAFTCSFRDGTYQVITASGVSASTFILPSPKDGSYFWISNVASSAQSLNVNDHDGATLSTVAAGEGCLVVCDAAEWYLIIKA